MVADAAIALKALDFPSCTTPPARCIAGHPWRPSGSSYGLSAAAAMARTSSQSLLAYSFAPLSAEIHYDFRYIHLARLLSADTFFHHQYATGQTALPPSRKHQRRSDSRRGETAGWLPALPHVPPSGGRSRRRSHPRRICDDGHRSRRIGWLEYRRSPNVASFRRQSTKFTNIYQHLADMRPSWIRTSPWPGPQKTRPKIELSPGSRLH